MIYARSRLRAAATAAAAALVLLSAPTGGAAEAAVCSGGWKNNVYNYTSQHHPVGKIFKNGPGGSVTVTTSVSGTVSTSVTGTTAVTADFVVAQAKAEISGTAARSNSASWSGSYTRSIAAGKYGNVQYGVWGHNATWERYYELPDCRKTQRTSGSTKISNSSEGFRYWETSY